MFRALISGLLLMATAASVTADDFDALVPPEGDRFQLVRVQFELAGLRRQAHQQAVEALAAAREDGDPEEIHAAQQHAVQTSYFFNHSLDEVLTSARSVEFGLAFDGYLSRRLWIAREAGDGEARVDSGIQSIRWYQGDEDELERRILIYDLGMGLLERGSESFVRALGREFELIEIICQSADC